MERRAGTRTSTGRRRDPRLPRDARPSGCRLGDARTRHRRGRSRRGGYGSNNLRRRSRPTGSPSFATTARSPYVFASSPSWRRRRAAVQAIGASVEGRTIWAPADRRHRAGRHADADQRHAARARVDRLDGHDLRRRSARTRLRHATPRSARSSTAPSSGSCRSSTPTAISTPGAAIATGARTAAASHGVDLNRNFAVAWGGTGSSRNERSETYRGAHAFSEPESSALRDLAKREHIALHVDFHAYGQLVLYPWSYTATRRPRIALGSARIGDRHRVGDLRRAREALPAESAASTCTPPPATMTDWMYGEAGRAVVHASSCGPRAAAASCCRPRRSGRPATRGSRPCSRCEARFRISGGLR